MLKSSVVICLFSIRCDSSLEPTPTRHWGAHCLLLLADTNQRKKDYVESVNENSAKFKNSFSLLRFRNGTKEVNDTRLNQSVVPENVPITLPSQRNGRMGPLLLSRITQLISRN